MIRLVIRGEDLAGVGVINQSAIGNIGNEYSRRQNWQWRARLRLSVKSARRSSCIDATSGVPEFTETLTIT